jgi:SAM-dependent methyltransferase
VSELTDQARRNREYWDRTSDWYQGHAGRFVERGLAWGAWQVPEAELRVLGDVAGRDVLELGCGAAEWSRALARAGARPVGLDNSEARLAHARAALEAEGLDFPLVHASAESVPFPDESFDVVMCDWGATTFADPYLVVPEVARLLRPGGLFAFSGATPLSWLCWDEEEDAHVPRLCRPLFGMHRWDMPEGSVEFNLPTGEWIRLFVANGFVVEDLVEVAPPPGAASPYRSDADTEWGRSWAQEHIWKVRRR